MAFDADAAYEFDYVAFHSVGGRSVSRYIAPPDAMYDWKRITPAEALRIAQANLALRLNFETSTTGMELGAGAGNVAADAAQRALDIFPGADRTVWFSDDTRSTYDQVAPFCEVVANRMGPQGYYGGLWTGLRLQQAGLMSKVWVEAAAYASGFAGWPELRTAAGGQPGVHLIQHVDHPVPGLPAGVYDYNEILRDDYLGGTPVPLSTADVEVLTQAIGDYITRADQPLGWLIGVLKGDPKANQVANFLTDIHNAEGYLIQVAQKILDKVGQPAGSIDPAALKSVVKESVAEVLQSAHS